MNAINLFLNFLFVRDFLVLTLPTHSEYRPNRVIRLYTACVSELKRAWVHSQSPKWAAMIAKSWHPSSRVGMANLVFSFANASPAISMSVQSAKRLVQSLLHSHSLELHRPSYCLLAFATKCWRQRKRFQFHRSPPMFMVSKRNEVPSARAISSSVATMVSRAWRGHLAMPWHLLSQQVLRFC